VYRNFLGATQFTGVINSKVAKVKEHQDDKLQKYKAKIAIMVRDLDSKKFEIEHCLIEFIAD
jgi:hypothetical protein